MDLKNKKIIVAIPCYNEELTITKVINDFRNELIGAEILVINNNSRDQTEERAKGAGATVIFERKQGKGFAVRKVFDEFDGDILVLVDGDDTYSAKDVHKLILPVANGEVEMAVGNRLHADNTRSFKSGHWLGNKFLTMILNFMFRTKLKDMESGFRVIDRKFVESSALLASGFGIEPELTIQALERGFKIKEVPISIHLREKGSQSKLNTMRDGTIVLYTIISLFRDYKPLQFFSFLSSICIILGAFLSWYSVRDYISVGIVYHIPSLIASGFFIIASFISFVAGLILSSIKRRSDELLVILERFNKKK